MLSDAAHLLTQLQHATLPGVSWMPAIRVGMAIAFSEM
jgi:hypothetical protein